MYAPEFDRSIQTAIASGTLRGTGIAPGGWGEAPPLLVGVVQPVPCNQLARFMRAAGSRGGGLAAEHVSHAV